MTRILPVLPESGIEESDGTQIYRIFSPRPVIKERNVRQVNVRMFPSLSESTVIALTIVAFACILAAVAIVVLRLSRQGSRAHSRKPFKCSTQWCGKKLHHLHERANLILILGVEIPDELHDTFPNATIITAITDNLLYGTVDLVILGRNGFGAVDSVCPYVRPFGYIICPTGLVPCRDYCHIAGFDPGRTLYRRCHIGQLIDSSKRRNGTVVALNYASDSHLDLQIPCTQHLVTEFKADAVVSYGPDDVDKLFESHPDIMNTSRGAGLWSWKAPVILFTMMATNADVILYCDSSTKMLWDRDRLVNTLGEKNILAFVTMWEEHKYTKRDTFVEFIGSAPSGSDQPMKDITNSNQFAATASAYRCGSIALDFLKDWADLCTRKELVSDDENVRGLPNYEGFVDHRHDQSIFSLLVKTRYKAYTKDVSAWQVYAQHFFG